MPGLDRPQLLHQPVVLGVDYLRLVEHVIAVVVVVDLLTERFGARLERRQVVGWSLRVGLGGGHRANFGTV